MANWRKDWFIMGSLAGAIASIIKTLINFGFYKSKISKIHYVDIAGGMILGKRKGDKPRTPLEYGLGIIADTMLGAIFGSGLAWLIGKTPKGFEVTKGTLFGTTLWGTTLSFGTLLKIDGLSKPSARTMTTMLSSSMAFGAGTGALIKKFAQFEQSKMLQPSTVSLQDNNLNNENKIRIASK